MPFQVTIIKQIIALNLITSITTLSSPFKKLQQMLWIKKRRGILSSPYEDKGLHASCKALSLSVEWFLGWQPRASSSGPPARPAWGPWYSQQLSTHRTLIAMRPPIGTKNWIVFPCATKSPILHVRPKSTTDILEHRKKLDVCQLTVMLTTLFSDYFLELSAFLSNAY